MTTMDKKNIQMAEMPLPCNNLNETLNFFTDKLGFKIESIFPAEKPSLAIITMVPSICTVQNLILWLMGK